MSAESSSDLKKRMQKLWSLILTIRRSETMLREIYTKMGGKPLTKTDSSVKNLEDEVRKSLNLFTEISRRYLRTLI